jgi:hypothetical protein
MFHAPNARFLSFSLLSRSYSDLEQLQKQHSVKIALAGSSATAHCFLPPSLIWNAYYRHAHPEVAFPSTTTAAIPATYLPAPSAVAAATSNAVAVPDTVPGTTVRSAWHVISPTRDL